MMGVINLRSGLVNKDMPEDPTVTIETEAEEENEEFVTQSSRRVAVLERLVEGPADAATIASAQPVGVASAQSATEELRQKGLVELLATEDERAYGLTIEGEKALFSLEQEGKI